MKKMIAAIVCLVMAFTPMTVFGANGPSQQNDDADYEAYISFTDYSGSGINEIYVFKNNKARNKALPGATYDKETNTLTLENLKKPDYVLTCRMMGDDFKIKAKGNNKLSTIELIAEGYGNNLTITGDGRLRIYTDSWRGIQADAGRCPVKIHIDKDVTVMINGEDYAVRIYDSTLEDATQVLTIGDESVELNRNETAEKETKTIKGVYKEDSGTLSGKQGMGYWILCDSDPAGFYAGGVDKDFIENKDDPYDEEMGEHGHWKINGYEICRYVYNEELGGYAEDPDFGILNLTPAEFEKSDYHFKMSKWPKSVGFWDYGEENGGYLIKKQGTDGTYCIGGYEFYPGMQMGLYKYSKPDKDGCYTKGEEVKDITLAEFDQQGFTFELDEEGYPIEKDYYIKEKDLDGSFYLVNNPKDPGGVYGVWENPCRTSSIYSLKYNDNKKRYEVDDELGELSKNDFEGAGWQYVLEDQPEDAFEFVLRTGPDYYVYKDKNGKEYASMSDTARYVYEDGLYSFSEDKKVKLFGDDGGDWYVLTPVAEGSVKTGDLSRVKVTKKYYDYATKGAELIADRGFRPEIEDISGMKAVLGQSKFVYEGWAFRPEVRIDGLFPKADFTVSYKNNKNAGKATVTITGKDEYTGTITKNFTIAKAKNPLKVKGKTAKVRYSKSKNRKLKASKIVKFLSKGKGTLTYKRVKGNKKITIAKNGTVTVKKGLKKGKYKVTFKVKAAGTKNYKASTFKKFTTTIRVK